MLINNLVQNQLFENNCFCIFQMWKRQKAEDGRQKFLVQSLSFRVHGLRFYVESFELRV